MKIDITKDWCSRMAHLESDEEIGTGLLASLDSAIDAGTLTLPHRASFEDHNIAFGRLIQLMRRNVGYSIESLAENANIDIEEIIEIEESNHCRPDIRTVYQLANVFKLPRANLLKVAGLLEAQNDSLYKEAVRFAARSEPVSKLTVQEKEALDAFILILSKE